MRFAARSDVMAAVSASRRAAVCRARRAARSLWPVPRRSVAAMRAGRVRAVSPAMDRSARKCGPGKRQNSGSGPDMDHLAHRRAGNGSSGCHGARQSSTTRHRPRPAPGFGIGADVAGVIGGDGKVRRPPGGDGDAPRSAQSEKAAKAFGVAGAALCDDQRRLCRGQPVRRLADRGGVRRPDGRGAWRIGAPTSDTGRVSHSTSRGSDR